MNAVLQKLWNENGISIILLALIILYGLVMFFKYLDAKGKTTEYMNKNVNSVYSDNTSAPQPNPTNPASSTNMETTGVRPSEPLGQNDNFASVSGGSQPISSCSKSSDPSQLLPQDTNSQWSQTNPMGQGNLANVNFLKAGEHIGINTIGSSLKNPNLQLRSEPPVSRAGNTGIWNQSSYEPDLMRPSFEIGQA